MKPKLVIYNGPPNSGKDHVCDFLDEHILMTDKPDHDSIMPVPMMFKDWLYKVTAAVYGMDLTLFKKLAMDRHDKEQPRNELNGLSPRKAMIHVSEDVIKPAFGRDHFGQLTARTVRKIADRCLSERTAPQTTPVFLFSDGGFKEEFVPVIETVGWNNSMIVRVHRPGCDFSNDSRTYLKSTDFDKKIKIVDLYNNSTLANLEQQAYTMVMNFIKEK